MLPAAPPTPPLHDTASASSQRRAGPLPPRPWLSAWTCSSLRPRTSTMSSARTPHLPKGPDFADNFEIFGESLINTDGETWRAQRRMIHNLMTSRSIACICNMLRAPRQPRQGGERPHPASPPLRRVERGGRPARRVLAVDFDTTCALVLAWTPAACLTASDRPVRQGAGRRLRGHLLRHVVRKSWLEIGRERKLAAAARVMDAFVDETIAAKESRWRP
ncbi:hypothetical protein ACMD2_26231 [Ananas comosus]|uniref:Uncharacterized protein n=1 Tax=Ananas comosus TaxID=4615 RepID=A0A199UUY8_ANACO|nr:hypothetical protein ACMD2_26231 [Ananas comosus]